MIIKSKMTLKNRPEIAMAGGGGALGEKKERIKRARNLSMLDQYDEVISGRTSRMVDQEAQININTNY
jgi:hypothetical protein